MDYYIDDLVITFNDINLADILSPWLWLVKDVKEVLIISKLGDLFFIGNDNYIYWLATDNGILTKIADNKAEFDHLLNDDENLDNWFLPRLLDKLDKAGMRLTSKQVYNYKKMPVLGGEFSVENIECVDINIHFTLTGVICEQIKDLPNGTAVKIKVVD